MYGHSEVESLRDDDSVRSNSLRRAISGSSEIGQGIMDDTRASNREVKDTQRAMPPPREVVDPGTSCKRNQRAETELRPLQTKKSSQAR